MVLKTLLDCEIEFCFYNSFSSMSFLLMISRPQCLTKNHKNNKKAFKKNLESLMFNIGGVGGIRTHARDKPSNDLAILQLAICAIFLVYLVQFVHYT